MEATPLRPSLTNWLPLVIFTAFGASFFLPVTLGEGPWLTEANGFMAISQLLMGSGEYVVLVFPIVFGPSLFFCIGLSCLVFRERIAAAVFGFFALCSAVLVGWAGASGEPPEPGHTLGPGFYLWAACMLGVVVAGLFSAWGRVNIKAPH